MPSIDRSPLHTQTASPLATHQTPRTRHITMKRGQGRSAAGRPGAAFGAGFGGFGGQGSGSSLSYLAEPPSFAAIADPNVVVSLKNVLKKDSTTKTKALDELLAYVQAHPHDMDGGVEDAILDVWVSHHHSPKHFWGYLELYDIIANMDRSKYTHVPQLIMRAVSESSPTPCSSSS